LELQGHGKVIQRCHNLERIQSFSVEIITVSNDTFQIDTSY